jgi:hypothetical protein
MRNIVIGLAAVVVMSLPATVAPAAPQPRPWCLQGGEHSPGGGLLVCTYQTLEQCRGSIGGGDEACVQNPALLWDRIEGRRSPPPRQQSR